MFNEGEWSAFLSRELSSTVHVRFGRARQRVLEACHKPGLIGGPSILKVRLSSFFAEAPEDVRDAVAHWLRVGRRARKSSALLDAWIETAVEQLPPAANRRISIYPRGIHHDLTPIALGLKEHPALLPELDSLPAVTWGRRTPTRARRSLQLGCYIAADELIRIHPVLDQDWVPEWFLRYVLFHELLHAALPSERGATGRAVHHGRAFKEWERKYPEFSRAVNWLDRYLPKLLSTSHRLSKRSGPISAKTAAVHSEPPTRELPAARAASSPKPAAGWLFPFLN